MASNLRAMASNLAAVASNTKSMNYILVGQKLHVKIPWLASYLIEDRHHRGEESKRAAPALLWMGLNSVKT